MEEIKYNLHNNGKFIDYFQKRDDKFQDMVNKQFDGGQSFFKSHD